MGSSGGQEARLRPGGFPSRWVVPVAEPDPSHVPPGGRQDGGRTHGWREVRLEGGPRGSGLWHRPPQARRPGCSRRRLWVQKRKQVFSGSHVGVFPEGKSRSLTPPLCKRPGLPGRTPTGPGVLTGL